MVNDDKVRERRNGKGGQTSEREQDTMNRIENKSTQSEAARSALDSTQMSLLELRQFHDYASIKAYDNNMLYPASRRTIRLVMLLRRLSKTSV